MRTLKDKKKYQLLYNTAAGEYYVKEWTQQEIEDWETSGYSLQEGHYSQIGLYDSEEALKKAIEELKGPDIFAVFENRPAGIIYSSKEDGISGNWRGSREYPASLIAEFDSQEEADQFIKEREEN